MKVFVLALDALAAAPIPAPPALAAAETIDPIITDPSFKAGKDL